MKRLLVLLLFMLPFFAVAQTKKGIRTTSVETDTLYVKKLSNYDLSKMLVVDTTTGKVYMRTYTPYTNTSYCVEIIDTVYYNCDTIEVAEDTLWLSGDNDPQDLGYIIIPAHDSIYCENYVVNIDTVCYPFPYSYSPWTRSWTNETVFLNHLNDDVGVGTHLPTVQFETTKDLAVGRGVYFKGGSGDVDLDGDVDGADITKLRRYLVGLSSTSNPAIKWTYPELVAMDVNGNGTIGEDDYDAMLMTIATGALYYSDPRTYYDSSKRVQGKSLYRMISGSTILGDKYATFSVFPSTIDKYTVEVNGSIRVPYNDSLVFGGYKTAAATQTIITVNKSRENLLTVTGSLEVAGTDTLFANNEIYAIGMTASTTATNLVSKLSSGQLVTVPYITSLGGSVTSVVVVAGTGISVAGSVVTQTGVFTVTNTAPDQTVVITGAGISTVASSYPTFTITTTEVDGSTTNELQSLSITGTSTPTVSLSIGGGDFTLIGDGSTSLSTSNDTITINTPVVDSILPQGLNSVMAIDSTTQHRYNAWIAGGTTGIVMTLAHEDFTPRIRMIHNDWGAKADTGLMQIDGGGCNSYWDGTYEKLFWNSLDSFPNYELALKKVIIKGSASQDWTRTANGTYLSFYTTANDSLTAREAMRITQDKKVAIGTTSPTAQLTVAKNVHLDAPGRSMAFDSVYVKDLSTGDLKTTHKSSMGLLDNDSSSWYHNTSRNSTYLKYPNDRVSIGTNATTANTNRKLHVAGSQLIEDSLYFSSSDHYITEVGEGTGLGTDALWQARRIHASGAKTDDNLGWFNNDVKPDGIWDSTTVITAKGNLVVGDQTEQNERLYVKGTVKVPYVGQSGSFDSVYVKETATNRLKTAHKSSLGSVMTKTTIVAGTGSITVVESPAYTYTINNTSPPESTFGTVTAITATSPLTGGTITSSGSIGITQSTSAVDGYLSSTDWTTFNNKIGGSGTANYVPKFSGTKTVTNSVIYDDGTNIGIGTTTPLEKLDIRGDINLNTNGTAAILSTYKGEFSNGGNIWIGNGGQNSVGEAIDGTTGAYNTAVGYNAMLSNTRGKLNTAVGTSALRANTTGNYNSAIGYTALESNTTGSYNNAFGYGALTKNTTGVENMAIGYGALQQNITGGYNIAVGGSSMINNTSGSDNVAIGYDAMNYNTTGESNVGIGSYSLQNNTTGFANTGIGRNALYYNTTGYRNTAIGDSAMRTGTTYNNSTAIGYNAQVSASNQVVIGDANVTSTILRGAVQASSLTRAASGDSSVAYNTATRQLVVVPNTVNGGGSVTAVGLAGSTGITVSGAKTITTTGTWTLTVADDSPDNEIQNLSWNPDNTSIDISLGGESAYIPVFEGGLTGLVPATLTNTSTLYLNASGGWTTPGATNYWTLNGNNIYNNNNSGTGYIGVGTRTPTQQLELTGNLELASTVAGTGNGIVYKGTEPFIHEIAYSTFLGKRSGNYGIANASYNTGIGEDALAELTTGNENTTVGYYAGGHLTTGSYNTLIGSTAGYYNITGNRNTSIGDHAGAINNGNDNISIGYESGYSNIAPKTGYGNIAIGSKALFNITSGYSNIAIGDSTSISLTTKYNTIAIGDHIEPTASNQVILGNSSITSTILAGAITTTGTLAQTDTPSNIVGITSNGKLVIMDKIDPTTRYAVSVSGAGAPTLEVLATGTGITAVFNSPNELVITIPSGTKLISSKIRFANNQSSLKVKTGTGDMGNSSLTDRWMPVVQAWKESDGTMNGSISVKMISTVGSFDGIQIDGLVSTTTNHIRLVY